MTLAGAVVKILNICTDLQLGHMFLMVDNWGMEILSSEMIPDLHDCGIFFSKDNSLVHLT